MTFTTKQIADILNGTIIGNENEEISTVSKIEEGEKGSLSFLANPQYTSYIYKTKASAVIVKNDFIPEKAIECTLIKVENPYESFAKLLEIYNLYKETKQGIEQPCFISEGVIVPESAYIGAFAYIGKNAKIGENVKIYPQAYIGDGVNIGENTTIFSGVKIYHECIIGKNCTLHSGVVIGADGFGFAPQKNDDFKKVAQIGNVILEDNIEIGANTTIDRATLGSTTIKKGVKIDNLVQIGHNVEIGQHSVIVAQTGIAGSSKIGQDCMIGGQVGIAGHLTITDGVKIAAQSGIGRNITEKNSIVQGSPAFSYKDYQKAYVIFRKLPELYASITEIEKNHS